MDHGKLYDLAINYIISQQSIGIGNSELYKILEFLNFVRMTEENKEIDFFDYM